MLKEYNKFLFRNIKSQFVTMKPCCNFIDFYIYVLFYSFAVFPSPEFSGDATTVILPDNDALYHRVDMAKEGNMLMEETGDPESLR